jgi:hypothetical protein
MTCRAASTFELDQRRLVSAEYTWYLTPSHGVPLQPFNTQYLWTCRGLRDTSTFLSFSSAFDSPAMPSGTKTW